MPAITNISEHPEQASPTQLGAADPNRGEVGEETSAYLLDDRFEVCELLGGGGFAWVYECKDRSLHRRVALKVFKKQGDATTRQRFIDEAHILANVHHPHLVNVLAIGETDTKEPYMALELLPGEDLDERLRREGPLPWREVALLAAQVASALESLHSVGVIHRDVKPSNIVALDSATGRPLVKLIDLGVAKVHDWGRVHGGEFTPSPRPPTADRMVVGTPGFSAPEAGHSQPAPPYDIFSLGVTIHLLCTGKMPDLVTPRPMGEIRGDAFPAEFEALVKDALAVLAEDRIATACALERRLEAILKIHADDLTPYLFDGCYELLEVLGVGAKAEVHRAYHRDAGRTVALKILGERAAADPEERRRFAREGLALATASDPALPSFVDCRTGAHRNPPFIAMSLAPGRRASEFCVSGRCLSPADVIAVGKQLGGGLAALHARGILHRDVHAGNVLIDVGDRTTATLIDIGMAHFEDAYYARAQLRYLTPPEARVPLGTGGLELLEWTAPEARAHKQWTARSDVYSLGLLLYRLLTGKRPMKNGVLVSPRTFVPGCPRSLESALLTALHADPKKRLDLAGLLARLDDAAAELRGREPEDEAQVATPRHRPRAWARQAMLVGLGGALMLGVMWLRGDHPPVSVDGVTQRPPVVAPLQPADPRARVAADAVRPAPLAQLGPMSADLPSMQDALGAAEAAVRGCAARVVVEFTTSADKDGFAAVRVMGSANPDVDRCVRDATATLRFQPQPSLTFIKEYKP